MNLVKAFDTVNQDVLMKILAWFDLPEHLISVIRCLYKPVRMKFKSVTPSPTTRWHHHSKIKQNLPPIINTDIGLQQLAQYINYSEEQMELIDWASYHVASKTFTSTALSRAHASKSFINLMYTDAQAQHAIAVNFARAKRLHT